MKAATAPAVAVGRTCPARRDGAKRAGILVYGRPYLCDAHREMWHTEDARDQAREMKRTKGEKSC